MIALKKVIATIILVLITLYLTGVFYHNNRFPSKVYVNETNIGGSTLKKAENKLERANVWEKITIKSNTEEFLEIIIIKINLII